ncbi:polyphenol oxidase, chloroplastic-like [Vitis vinifera]|uniref:polyphenol oxidase, chloroplastic-like n=1 Tax=Vitis vinifera TaxID=29760 RepID=UPI0005402FB8|nr:polyphenol oxidase, chloroplastic-like [Vitis vinifera]
MDGSPIQVLPQRPKTSRTKKEKDEAIEVLVIEGIKVPHGAAARFDVYVAKPMEGQVGPDVGELAGSFVNLPHAHYKFHIKKPKSRLELGIISLVEDIEAESSEKLVVIILPRMGEV